MSNITTVKDINAYVNRTSLLKIIPKLRQFLLLKKRVNKRDIYLY